VRYPAAANKLARFFISPPWFEQIDLIVLRDARNGKSLIRVRGLI